jgi:hypothetical protein
MTGVVGLSASNLDIKRGILHTQIFWQLTRQSLLMLLTHLDIKFGLLHCTKSQKTLYAAQ